MSKRARSNREQSRHDQRVKSEADKYRRKGYRVKADDVDGYTDPEGYHGRVPDVVARKDGHITLVEVETKSSVDTTRDKKQRARFKAWAGRKSNRHFRRVVV